MGTTGAMNSGTEPTNPEPALQHIGIKQGARPAARLRPRCSRPAADMLRRGLEEDRQPALVRIDRAIALGVVRRRDYRRLDALAGPCPFADESTTVTPLPGNLIFSNMFMVLG